MKSNLLITTIFIFISIMIAGCQYNRYPDQPLDWAFFFASGIESDAKDRAKFQEATLRTGIALGRLEWVSDHVALIENWRRAALAADLSIEYQLLAEPEQASSILQASEEWSKEVTGWRKERVRAHLAYAYGIQGLQQQVQRHTKQVLDREDSFKAILSVGLIHIANKDYDKAIEFYQVRRDKLDFTKSIELMEAYFKILRLNEIQGDDELKNKFISEAAITVEDMKAYRRALYLAKLTKVAVEIGADDELTRELIQQADDSSQFFDDAPRYAIPLLALVAHCRAATGDADRALEITQKAQSLFESENLNTWDKTLILPSMLTAFKTAGLEAQLDQWLARCLEFAREQPNSRIRAISMVMTGQAMAEAGMELTPELKSEFIDIYQSLGDPW